MIDVVNTDRSEVFVFVPKTSNSEDIDGFDAD